MLKNKVFITDIDNLTDARYFAAWMVDWLSFPVDRVKASDIIEITNWLEGSNFALQISESTSRDEIFELSQKANIKGLLSSKFDEDLKRDFPDLTLFFVKDDTLFDPLDELSYVLVKPKEFSLSTEEDGIWLKAQGEDKTGFKDFNEIDRVFDALSE